MKRSLLLALTAALALLAGVPVAGAATFTVNRLGDPVPGACTRSHCTLREAIRAANAHAGADRIVLPSTGPYRLARPSTGEDGAMDGDLDITNHPLTIVHPGRGRATIDARDTDRVFEIFVGAGTTLVKLVITGGNHASSAEAYGGGIRTTANLKIVDSKVSGNVAAAPAGSGGGISAAGGRLTILRSSINGNVADDSSGAIDIENHGVVIRRSTMAHNRAEFAGVGYWYGDGASLIEDSTFSKNRGTGDTATIYYSESAGSLTVRRSTFSGNVTAGDAGGFSARNGTVRMVNTTIAGNRAGGFGGGLWALTPVELNSVTIARNVADSDSSGGDMGGGIYDASSSTFVDITNSLVALNRLGDGRRNDCAGDPVDSFGNNLVSVLGPTDICDGFDAPGDLVRANPRIGLLKANGGATRTVALAVNSPARNRANPSTAPGRDQRGVRRSDPDIGAYERKPTG